MSSRVKEQGPRRGGRLARIIEHWDRAGLCSAAHSTCSGSRWFAEFDNYLETRLLSDIIRQRMDTGRSRRTALDVGAGYGRFSEVLAKHFGRVHAIEAAPNVYCVLRQRMAGITNVRCHCTCFENFDAAPRSYDFVVVSGILYLYDDDMVNDFLQHLSGIMGSPGYVLIRDFVVYESSVVIPSGYVEGSYCHYRSAGWWREESARHSFALACVRPSKPQFFRLRRCRPLGLLMRLGQGVAAVSRVLACAAYWHAKRAVGLVARPGRIYTAYLLLEKIED